MRTSAWDRPRPLWDRPRPCDCIFDCLHSSVFLSSSPSFVCLAEIHPFFAWQARLAELGFISKPVDAFVMSDQAVSMKAYSSYSVSQKVNVLPYEK